MMDECIVKNGKVEACDSLRNELREDLDECLREGMFNYCKWCGTNLTEDTEPSDISDHIGSSFDSFLEEQGIKEEVEAKARKKVAELHGWSLPIGDFPDVEVINGPIITTRNAGMFSITSAGVIYSRIENMYKTGDGVGLQVNDESKRTKIEKACDKVYNSILQLEKILRED
jgi:hypothetical protein